MVKYLVLFILSAYNGYGALKTIECSEGSCSTNFLPQKQSDKLYYSSIDVGQQNADDIEVKVNQNSEPRSVRLAVENNVIGGRNMSVSLTPRSDKANAGDLIILGDFLNNITVNLDGYTGTSGKNSSRMCYEEYAKGDNGAFSSELYRTFNDARFLDPMLPKNDCVSFDVDNLFNTFSCEPGFTEVEDANNPSVLVSRLKGKNRCLGLGFINVCLSKTVKVECTYRVKYVYPEHVAGTFDPSALKKETRVLKLPELEYEANKNDPAYRKFICDNLSYIDGTEIPYDIVQNGEFYFNISGWSNTSAVWDSSERMRLLPDIQQRKIKPTAQQVLNTIPSDRYRVQVLWAKDSNNVNVDSAKVTVYSDMAKTSTIASQSVFERGSIKPVFLTIDNAPHDFGLVKVGANLVKNLTLKNKDSRAAKNCSVIYMQGDTSSFQIEDTQCGTANLESGATCSFNIRPLPQGYGKKEVTLKRDCEDEFGNFTSALNEKISMVVYNNYIQGDTTGATDPNKFVDGFYWRYENDAWLKCESNYDLGRHCRQSTPIEENIEAPFTTGRWFRGYLPPHMSYTPGLIFPDVLEPALVKKVDVSLANRIDSKEIDFIFQATSANTVLELATLLPEHGAVYDRIIVTHLSQTAGPSVKPPSDLKCPTPASPGCVSGTNGHGYYDLESVIPTITSPGYDERYYTIPEGSDWRIRYVGLNDTCPQFFTLEKAEHLASNIGYDDNDNLCDDVYIPEDPSSKLIRWQFVNFERKPEFGTEMIQCSASNCLVSYTVEDATKHLITFNLGSGTNGSQQGEGVLFVYDFNTISATARNGEGGSIGQNNLPNRSERRACAKISDSITEGLESSWAINPKVNFIKYNWEPLKVINEGNYGRTPVNNGKEIKYYKKIDSSVRYLLKNEIF